MPPAAKKNASVILYDVNCDIEFQNSAKECLLNICSTKWFSASKDCTKLILLNTAETNVLNTKFSSALHISEVTSVIQYDPKLILQHLEDVETGEGDWIVALALALESLKCDFATNKGVMGLQLLFITDFSNTSSELKEKQICYITNTLNALNCFLYVLGPQVKIPAYMSSFEDIQQWSKNVEFVQDETPHLSVVKRIVESTSNSVVCGLDLGEQLFNNYRNYWGLQPWQVPLTIGSELQLPSSMIRFLRAVDPPKIKAQTTEKVDWSWHLSTDIGAEVPYDNVIGGVLRHGKFVPLPKDVENNFKCQEPRCFKIIGFTELDNISEVCFCGDGSAYVQSNNSKYFDLLLQKLAKQNMCAIAKRIYMANCKPKLYALLPREQEKVFIAVALPYKDNAAINPTEQDLQEAPSINNPLMNNVNDFLNRLDVTKSENLDENGSVKIPLNGIFMNPIRLSVVNRQLRQKYFGNEVTNEDYTSPNMLDDFNPYLDICPARNTNP